MASNLEITWKKYALISEIVLRFSNMKYPVGKTALQKMIFILEKCFDVEVDYTYTLYTYGPYCADVARDLDILESAGVVAGLHDPTFERHEIQPGESNRDTREQCETFLNAIEPKLDSLISDFGAFSAKELELHSTLIYLAKPGLARDELIQQVHDVKPHLTPQTIENALHGLEQAGYVGRLPCGRLTAPPKQLGLMA
jgi:uncharacterized protein YwgA